MGRPPIFSALAFDEAIDVAKTTGKVLLVDVTAPKCGPCQVMDRSTWSDRSLIAALRDRALAIQVDAGEHAAIAERLSVRTMPTVLVFKDGAEIDRMTGLQNSEQILGWLDGLERGETALSRMRAEIDERDVSGRLQLAALLVENRRHQEALHEYLWLWQNMIDIDPAMIGVRHSSMLSDIEELIGVHPPAHAAFVQLRDACEPSMHGVPDSERLSDWLSLTKLVGEGAQSPLAWFDAWWPVAAERIDFEADAGSHLAWFLEHEIVPLLMQQGRWADAGVLFRAPLQTLQQRAALCARTRQRLGDEPERATLLRHVEQSLRDDAARLVRSLRASGRIEEAAQVATEARRLDPSQPMAHAVQRAHDDSPLQ